MIRLRNPLIDRTAPPQRFGTRAARWGALACAVGLGVMLAPVASGWRAAGAGEPAPAGGSAWADLRRAGWEMAAR
ncbi:hypothetical protein [Jannaschia sp. W003]|uniref:hypothetical protein n=1 Tax=Jannaschia sp. W003 TaxID=2867012 RepID=UPI0021A72233|nr:hypothetical protein [Jannaschia sp. W003]UWQ21101.1 hypothetical protein K3554_14165 [Jannaschia sp. W003]